jgi:glycosyltransferase involved in cell wall biosynthesis
VHIGLFVDAKLPPERYGGTERVVLWLGRALIELGHKVTYFAHAGSRVDFAEVRPAYAPGPDRSVLPADLDILHYHGGVVPEEPGLPVCQTVHGNSRLALTYHPNSIFVSANHAHNHNATAFVHNGMDAVGLPEPDFSRGNNPFVFLAKAAWKAKNVRGAIDVARKAGGRIEVLGGTRLNLKMGFRLTLDPRARFHGMVGDAEKSKYLLGSRGLIFPVLWNEPFGVAVAEAMYFGAPVFATPYGSLPELVTPETGHISASASELAEAARDPARYDRRAIHAHWQNHFSARKMALKYLDYYQRILDGETLHPGPIKAPATRTSELLPWLP